MCDPSHNFCFLGETLGYWLQTVAIVLSVAVTGYYARKAILANGESAKKTLQHNHETLRQRATIDLLLQENQDTEMIAAHAAVMALSDQTSLVSCLSTDSNYQEKLADIRLLLNRYEFVALGIRTGAFEESVYKTLKYSQVMNVWDKSKPLIMEIRRTHNKHTYYQEFEWLANRWLADPLKPRQGGS